VTNLYKVFHGWERRLLLSVDLAPAKYDKIGRKSKLFSGIDLRSGVEYRPFGGL